MTATFDCEYVSWARFYSLSRILCRRIYMSGYLPDCIVAIGRGGYMPARIVSDFLHVMNLASFKIEHYHGTRKKPLAVIRHPLAREVKGRKVLLVDDVCDSGDTFELAIKHLFERMQPEETRTAVIHYKKTSSYKPDYFAARIRKWRWIIYPWAAAEDIGDFIQQMSPKPATTAQIGERLTQDYGVRLPQKILADILALLQT